MAGIDHLGNLVQAAGLGFLFLCEDGLVDLELAGQSIIVTGGSSGIGLETARLLLAEGALVTICGRDESRLAVARSDLASAQLRTVRADVLDAGFAADVVARPSSSEASSTAWPPSPAGAVTARCST